MNISFFPLLDMYEAEFTSDSITDFKKLFMAILFTLKIFARRLPRGSHPEKYFYFVKFCFVQS